MLSHYMLLSLYALASVAANPPVRQFSRQTEERSSRTRTVQMVRCLGLWPPTSHRQVV